MEIRLYKREHQQHPCNYGTKILKYQKNQSRKQLDAVSSLECRFLGKNSHSPIKQEEAKVLEILK